MWKHEMKQIGTFVVKFSVYNAKFCLPFSVTLISVMYFSPILHVLFRPFIKEYFEVCRNLLLAP
jgi:hypothetical protein